LIYVTAEAVPLQNYCSAVCDALLSLRDDGCLDVVGAIHQLAEDFIEAG
jgi:hypothetical protein